MHFEVLVEDASASILLSSVLPRVVGADHTFRIHAYKGIGHVPRGLRPGSDPDKRILLDQLPRLLRGYGRSLHGQDAAVIVIVDQDDHDCTELLENLTGILKACEPRPETLFRLAIEETAPRAKTKLLETYVQDSVCGTWELLADAVHEGGAADLKRAGWPHVGEAKCDGARRIGPEIDVEHNTSRSFGMLRDGLRRLARH